MAENKVLSALPCMQEKRIAVTPPRLHFLVVDDSPVVRGVISALLKVLGHTTVSEAKNGEEALALLRSGNIPGMPINFVVTDWCMPVMDGLTLLRAIRASADLKDLPVLMVTAEAEKHHVTAATRAGADGYIGKLSLNAVIFKETLDQIMIKRGLAA